MRQASNADALLLVLDSPADWEALRKAGRHNLILCVSQEAEYLEGAEEHGIPQFLMRQMTIQSRS